MCSDYISTFEGKKIMVVPDEDVQEIIIPLSLMKWIDHLVDIESEYREMKMKELFGGNK